jgi:hypothetical protein
MRKRYAAKSGSLHVALVALAGLAGLFGAAASAADGLAVPAADSAWPTWRARLTLSAPHGEGLALGPAAPVRQAALLGDWYLTGAGPLRPNEWRGGLRATGGLVLGHLGHAASVSALPLSVSLLSAPDAQLDGGPTGLRPYLGVGYAGRSADGDFSVSADLGLVANQPGALFGAQGLSDAARRIELSPMLRLGVNYAF